MLLNRPALGAFPSAATATLPSRFAYHLQNHHKIAEAAMPVRMSWPIGQEPANSADWETAIAAGFERVPVLVIMECDPPHYNLRGALVFGVGVGPEVGDFSDVTNEVRRILEQTNLLETAG